VSAARVLGDFNEGGLNWSAERCRLGDRWGRTQVSGDGRFRFASGFIRSQTLSVHRHAARVATRFPTVPLKEHNFAAINADFQGDDIVFALCFGVVV
jgi:hypothetical protein